MVWCTFSKLPLRVPWKEDRDSEGKGSEKQEDSGHPKFRHPLAFLGNGGLSIFDTKGNIGATCPVFVTKTPPKDMQSSVGATSEELRKGPPFRGSRSYRVTNHEVPERRNCFCGSMSGREVTGRQTIILVFQGALIPMDFCTLPHFLTI